MHPIPFVLLLLAGATVPSSGGAPATFRLTSPAFAPGGAIPARHTCEGLDVSPPLAWSGAPSGTRAFALVVDDPDAPDPAAPRVRWVHWVVYDLPADLRALPEGVKGGATPRAAKDGVNDWGSPGWRGPCPPVGEHRYVFRLFALDTGLPDLRRPTRDQLLAALKGHVLATAELVGTYRKRVR